MRGIHEIPKVIHGDAGRSLRGAQEKPKKSLQGTLEEPARGPRKIPEKPKKNSQVTREKPERNPIWGREDLQEAQDALERNPGEAQDRSRGTERGPSGNCAGYGYERDLAAGKRRRQKLPLSHIDLFLSVLYRQLTEKSRSILGTSEFL